MAIEYPYRSPCCRIQCPKELAASVIKLTEDYYARTKRAITAEYDGMNLIPIALDESGFWSLEWTRVLIEGIVLGLTAR